MKELPKVLKSTTKIRFQDCDPFNHLNNANYINYMINAREDQVLEHYNLDIFKMARTSGKSWVASRNQIAYLKPAFLMETVLIESQLIRYTDSELHAELRMWDATRSQLKAVLWSTFVHFDLLKQKRANHNEELLELFSSITETVPETIFDQRIQKITEIQTV